MHENIRGKAVYDDDKRQKLIFVIALCHNMLCIQLATVLNNSVAPMYAAVKKGYIIWLMINTIVGGAMSLINRSQL